MEPFKSISSRMHSSFYNLLPCSLPYTKKLCFFLMYFTFTSVFKIGQLHFLHWWDVENIMLHSRLQLLRRLVFWAFLMWEAVKSFYFIFDKRRDMKVALKVFFVLLQTHSSVVDVPLVKQRRVMWNVQHAHVGAVNAAEYFSQPSTGGPEHQSWQRFEANRGFLGGWNLFIIYPDSLFWDIFW